jgi:DNA primase
LPQAPELVFCFDGDRAGREAGWKALETTLPLATGQQQIRFLFLPEGEDPDTLVRQEGREAFEGRVRQATPLSDFLFDRLTDQVDTVSLDGKARLAALARPLLSRIPNGLYRDMLHTRLASLVGVAAAELQRGTAGPRAPMRRPMGKAPANRPANTPLRLAIALILQYPRLASAAVAVAEDWRQLDRPGIGLLAELLDLTAAYPEITTAGLLERWRDRDQRGHMARLTDPRLLIHIPEEGLAAELAGALTRLNREATNVRTEMLFNRASTADWTEEEREMLRQRLLSPNGGRG